MPDRSSRPARVPPRPLIGLVCVAMLPVLAPRAVASDGYGIAWRTDVAQAQAEARARNLPLMMQFTGPWCIYCRKMDMFTFNDPGVINRINSRFVPVKVRSDARQDLVAQFGISGLPATVILSPSGRLLLGQTDGFSDASQFSGTLDGAWGTALTTPELLAMDGFCPVRLVEGKGRVPGDARLAVFYDGHAYRFADEAARDLFLKDPEKYLPSDGGRCVVTRKDDGKEAIGDPRFGATYHGRLFLFASAEARQKFADDPDAYSALDLADNGACPHCKTTGGQVVAGKPEIAATHAGRRYLFPEESHRQAFRAAPERYLR